MSVTTTVTTTARGYGHQSQGTDMGQEEGTACPAQPSSRKEPLAGSRLCPHPGPPRDLTWGRHPQRAGPGAHQAPPVPPARVWPAPCWAPQALLPRSDESGPVGSQVARLFMSAASPKHPDARPHIEDRGSECRGTGRGLPVAGARARTGHPQGREHSHGAQERGPCNPRVHFPTATLHPEREPVLWGRGGALQDGGGATLVGAAGWGGGGLEAAGVEQVEQVVSSVHGLSECLQVQGWV